MRKSLIGALLASLFLGSSIAAADPAQRSPDELRTLSKSLFGVIPHSADLIKDKALSDDQIELGRWLFFEPRLSASHIISCNTCHSVGTGGADNIPTSIGHGWQAGPRNSPTVFNAVFNVAQFWDGRAEDLKEQAKGPMSTAIEF